MCNLVLFKTVVGTKYAVSDGETDPVHVFIGVDLLLTTSSRYRYRWVASLSPKLAVSMP